MCECWQEEIKSRKCSRALFHNIGRLGLCSVREGERPEWGRPRKKQVWGGEKGGNLNPGFSNVRSTQEKAKGHFKPENV